MRQELAELVSSHGFWMTWNTTLAVMPWVLALALFRRPDDRARHIGPVWWLGAAAFGALLPNAAYVITDVIHLPDSIRAEGSDRVVVFGVLPLYASFFAVGFLAYVDSLRRLARFVVGRGWLSGAWPLVLAVHGASAVGIYIGRIHRFNSWDLATRPEAVLLTAADGLTRPLPVAGIAFTFFVLAAGFLVAKPILDAVGRRAAALSR